MGKEKFKFLYSAFITDLTKYGLFDDSGDLRYVSSELDSVMGKNVELGWGKIRHITLTKNGISFGKYVE